VLKSASPVALRYLTKQDLKTIHPPLDGVAIKEIRCIVQAPPNSPRLLLEGQQEVKLCGLVLNLLYTRFHAFQGETRTRRILESHRHLKDRVMRKLSGRLHRLDNFFER